MCVSIQTEQSASESALRTSRERPTTGEHEENRAAGVCGIERAARASGGAFVIPRAVGDDFPPICDGLRPGDERKGAG